VFRFYSTVMTGYFSEETVFYVLFMDKGSVQSRFARKIERVAIYLT